jgi:glucokinase
MSLAIGIDVGGTKVLGGVVDEDGKILATSRKETPREGGHALTQTIADVAHELMQSHRVSSVGVSAAGFISSDRKTMLATPNIKNWNGVNLHSELSKNISLPIVLENDANAAAWGESRFGAGRGFPDMVMVTLGTGIGGGIVIGESIFRGSFGMGAEIGHFRMVPDGHICGCGIRGCFEQYASGTALLRHAREAIELNPDAGKVFLEKSGESLNELSGSSLTQAARDGDPIALSAFGELSKFLGAGLASLSAILDPEIFIIGGGVIDAGEIVLAPTRRSMLELMPFSGQHPTPKIVAAQLGNSAGLVGVADLARN